MQEKSRVSSAKSTNVSSWTALGIVELERHGCIGFDLKKL